MTEETMKKLRPVESVPGVLYDMSKEQNQA